MSLFSELHILNEETFNSALGAILSKSSYKNRSFTNDDISAFLIEAGQRNFHLAQANIDRLSTRIKVIVPASTIPDTAEIKSAVVDDSDYRLALYYVNKVKNASERGIEFNLSLNDLRRLWRRTTCYYTGVKLTTEPGNKNTRTLDRVDNKLGYTKENTVVCSWAANQLKNELFEKPDGEFRISVSELTKMISKLSA